MDAEDHDPELETSEPATGTFGEVEEEVESTPKLGSGRVLGDRYEVRSILGRGAMGEVWEAYDLKLRVEVALKTLHPEYYGDQRRQEMLRREVRVAREVVSPNVCRVFDLVIEEGQEFLSMEHVDGVTLTRLIKNQGPLSLREAGQLAAQFLAGLHAIHEAGLVHRDFKPDNVMVTRTGRVVVMDFGIAKQVDSADGSVAGTPAYMAPEQLEGAAIDGRADIFAAGIVLAEMISAGGAQDRKTRETLRKAIRQSPPQLPDSPWESVLVRAVANRPSDRYATAQDLVRTLEKVTLRVDGAEQKHPYPGLSSYAAEDSEHFFGREAEVEALLKKLGRPHLLAVVGPSGAGKSSFLQAGFVPALEEGWKHLLLHPGADPFAALSQALTLELSDDSKAAPDLPDITDPDAAVSMVQRWSQQHKGALLIVDQFEELFTLNPPEIQASFATLLSRLAIEADVHVLLSMRDDFLFHCHRFSSLAPILSELTLLGPPTGSALRRALVHPALACGYTFEDEALVDEMLGEVATERGALPLLAFAAASLWERRERERGELTRAAYEEIGGVGGALAQHAEAALEQIGKQRLPIVHELFRNLVTADGTRATRERAELLSVLDDDDQDAGVQVLGALVDARLLTSFDVATGDGSGTTQQIEIIHESLLSAWPRLVRWRTHDADSAQVRDELRQAAQLWDKRGRAEDLLWTGTAFDEYVLWRERYPGGLTHVEDAFATAMVELSQRRTRRRRRAVTAALTLAIGLTAVMTTLWRQSEAALQTAEAQRLVAIGQLDLESYSTATLAYATKSLELADSVEARHLALRALWKGPPAWRVVNEGGFSARFSPDGETLLHTRQHPPDGEGLVRLVSSDGTSEVLKREHENAVNMVGGWWLGTDSDLFYTLRPDDVTGWRILVWSASKRQLLRKLQYENGCARLAWNAALGALVVLDYAGQVWADPVSATGPQGPIGSVVQLAPSAGGLSSDGRLLGVVGPEGVFLVGVEADRLSEPRRIGAHAGASQLAISPDGQIVATRDDQGVLKVWDLDGQREGSPRVLDGPAGRGQDFGFGAISISSDSSLLTMVVRSEAGMELWVLSLDDPGSQPRSLGVHAFADVQVVDTTRSQVAFPARPGSVHWVPLGSPDGTRPIDLQSGRVAEIHHVSFHPQGRWVSQAFAQFTAWFVARPYPLVFEGVGHMVFDPQGRWFAARQGRDITLWPLDGSVPGPRRTLWTDSNPSVPQQVAVAPDGSRLLVGTRRQSKAGKGPVLVSVETGSAVYLQDGFADQVLGVAYSPDGRFVAAGGGQFVTEERIVKVWEVESGELLAVLDDETAYPGSLGFTADNHVLYPGGGGLSRWDFATDEQELLYAGRVREFDVTADGRRAFILLQPNEAVERRTVAVDLETGSHEPMTRHGTGVLGVTLDPAGEVAVSVDNEGVVRVGPLRNEEPHLLFSHDAVRDAVLDPLGRWVVTRSRGETRFWPMPDMSQPPLHTLPYDQLLAKLHGLTNARIVEDTESSSGWRLEYDPFPGWKMTPT